MMVLNHCAHNIDEVTADRRSPLNTVSEEAIDDVALIEVMDIKVVARDNMDPTTLNEDAKVNNDDAQSTDSDQSHNNLPDNILMQFKKVSWDDKAELDE